MKYKLIVEYFGKNYNGWQRQKNGVGVQQVLEEKLSDLLGSTIKIVGSGRTDTGVHALGQVAHFEANTTIPPEKMVFALNGLLPDDIKVQRCEAADADFHAQYSAKRKTYRYQAYLSRIPSPLRDDRYARIVPPLDIEAMKRCAQKMVGVHDFAAFSSLGSEKKSTIREIYRCELIQNGDELYFEIEGNGFLYNMVRIIVGTLVFVGKGKLPESIADEMFRTGNRKAGGKTFPAKGLFLKSVSYTK